MSQSPAFSSRSPYSDAWPLEPAVTLLNHGSFGACPTAVLQRQVALRRQMEADPVRFLVREMQPLLDESRRALAATIGASPADLVLVSNATAGVNSVLRSLRFAPGDELLVTNQGYNACSNVARYVAERDGATVIVAQWPVPIRSPQDVVEAVLARTSPRTRIALLDHVTSSTAAILPIAELVRRLAEQGIDTLVDGAHAPGMLELDVAALGAAYYAGNCHKWLCAPKGAGFLYVRRDRQAGIQPPVISHGYNSPRAGYSRFQDFFDWPGTQDPSAWLCVGTAIEFLSRLGGAGLPGLAQRNRHLALAARRMLCQRFGFQPACPEDMVGSMAAMCLPDDPHPVDLRPFTGHRLADELMRQFGIEVPVYYWPEAPRMLLRISAHAYNDLAQYERLADALATLLPEL
jgi:isopenicillin-N epimerase